LSKAHFAICPECATRKADYRLACPACGDVPARGRLPVAWLLSTHFLSEAELTLAGERIRQGDPLSPRPEYLRQARDAVRRALGADPGLSQLERAALAFTSVFITSAPALVLAWWDWNTRPRRARQAVALGLVGAALQLVAVGIRL